MNNQIDLEFDFFERRENFIEVEKTYLSTDIFHHYQPWNAFLRPLHFGVDPWTCFASYLSWEIQPEVSSIIAISDLFLGIKSAVELYLGRVGS